MNNPALKASAPASDFMFQRQIETLPRDAIAEIQTERLQQTLHHAYNNISHYKSAFDSAGVKPEQLKSVNDLRHFPFTEKTDLRDNYPFGMFGLPVDRLCRLHASSGTTGKPTVVGYTAAEIENWSLLMARSMAAAGVRPGDIVHNAYGYGLFTGGLGAHQGAERLGCVVVPVSGGGTERQVMLMRDFGASVLCSTPSYALNIAEVAEAQGIDFKSLPLRCGLFGAEPWSEEMRGELDRRLGIKSVDLYGLSEIMGPGVACECDTARNGLHGWEDHFLFEIIDPDTLEPLPMGATGELVITTLTKETLPMIRYRTRDITQLNDEPCECGRTHVRISRFTGRCDDMMIIRGVNVYPLQLESVLARLPELSPHYQIVLDNAGAMDAMTVEVEADADVPSDDDDLTCYAHSARQQIKSIIGVTCEVVVKRPGEIPRSQGKAARIRDLRNKI